MRNSSRNLPSLAERMAADPQLAAEITAIQFEGLEQDRYDRERSFVCRHIGLFFILGFLMAFGPIIAILALASRIDFGSPAGLTDLTRLVAVSIAGVILVLFCAARPGSKNSATALGKVLLLAAMFLLVAIPMSGGFDAFMRLF